MIRYRFGDFVLSPRRRVLLRDGREQPLIPRYFDLLVFLVEHRADAVHRRDIFDRVWSDVVVSDSALSQAIRTIRRVLGDDSREPRFIRTVSRHGYQFVSQQVVEEPDESDWMRDPAPGPAPAVDRSSSLEGLLARIASPARDAVAEEEQRDTAERLHALGTAMVLERLGTGRDTAFARALLRDTRWDTPVAGPVPILGAPQAAAASWHLARLRLKRVAAIAAARWATASASCGVAGAIGGTLGGLLLVVAPSTSATLAVVPVLALVGAVCGSLAGAGVGAGLAVAESVMRSHRTVALAAGGGIGGGLVGLAIQLLGGWTLEVLVGISPHIGGGIEGLLIGIAGGLGYALATGHSDGGLAAPRGRQRVLTAGLTAVSCSVAALLLSLAGRPLVGGTIHAIAQASAARQALLTPLGRLIGEPDFGPVSAALIAMGEGAAFGLGLSLGMTRRG